MNALFHSVLAASWQAAVIAGLIGLASLLFRRWLAPSVRHALWFLVMARLICPVFPTSFTSVFNLIPGGSQKAPAIQPVPLAPPNATAEPPIDQISFTPIDIAPTSAPATSWNPAWILMTLWLAGVAFFSLRLLISWSRLRRLLAQAETVVAGEPMEILAEYRTRFGIRRKIAILKSLEVNGPALYGIFHPRLLLPTASIGAYGRHEWEMIFAHELAHVRRWDNAANWTATLLQIVHWFNPVIWLAFRQMRRDRELATDQLALSIAGEDRAADYGETLLQLMAQLRHPSNAPGLIGILEDGSQLKQRIKGIAAFRGRPTWSALGILLFVGLVCGGLTNPAPPPAENSSATEPEITIHLEGEFLKPGPLTLPPGVVPELVPIIVRSGGITKAGDLKKVEVFPAEPIGPSTWRRFSRAMPSRNRFR